VRWRRFGVSLPALLLSRRKVAMPVYVESVTQPSPQDLTDLAKIYADAPEWLLTPYASAEALIAAALRGLGPGGFGRWQPDRRALQ